MSREKGLDLEALEFFVRSRMLRAGARAIERILESVGAGRRDEPLLCRENHAPHPMSSRGLRDKTLRTILGPVRFRRSGFVCEICGKTRCPGDELLGVVGTGFSPGARRMMACAGAKESFAESADDLGLFADLKVDAKDVERIAEEIGRVVDDWMDRQGAMAQIVPERAEHPKTLYVSFDGTGIPMRPSELAGVRGKALDGKPKTREVKLGCVFTQT